MIQRIVKTLDELGFVRKETQKAELLAMSVPQLMEDFVLPCCLSLPRTGRRYPRIDGSFMELVTRHGKDFLEADYRLGNVLLELAMQRITRHPDLPAIDYKGNLPEKYKPYSAASINPNGCNGCPDEPGLWGKEEVHFIVEMLPLCLKSGERMYADHAKLILFQILTKITDGFFGMGEMYENMLAKDVWKAAYQMLTDGHYEADFVDYCVAQNGGWRIGFEVFKNWAWKTSPELLNYLLSKIDLDRETYFKGIKRDVLKFFRAYDKMTRECIVKELCA